MIWQKLLLRVIETAFLYYGENSDKTQLSSINPWGQSNPRYSMLNLLAPSSTSLRNDISQSSGFQSLSSNTKFFLRGSYHHSNGRGMSQSANNTKPISSIPHHNSICTLYAISSTPIGFYSDYEYILNSSVCTGLINLNGMTN